MNVENVLSIKCTTLFVNNGILCVKFRYRRRKETYFKSNVDHATGIAIVVKILECFRLKHLLQESAFTKITCHFCIRFETSLYVLYAEDCCKFLCTVVIKSSDFAASASRGTAVQELTYCLVWQFTAAEALI